MMSPSTSLVTIVMYHFVRPMDARFPRLAALDLSAFRQQLRYLRRHYSIVRLQDVVAAAEGVSPLPPRPAVLTFDDGYVDHYAHVFPLLAEEKIAGAFFPVRAALLDRTILDANKIQFVLAAAPDSDALVAEIDTRVAASRDGALRSVPEYRAQWWNASRFDTPAVTYIKGMLQHALPAAVRRPLLDSLFHRFVSADEASFASSLYFTVDQAREMRAAGMEFGGHGDHHLALTTLGRDGQAAEIDGAISALEAIGAPKDRFPFSYVKGDFNATSIELLRARGCVVAVTTRVDLGRPVPSELLELPRIDANDLPSKGDAPPNAWTLRALAGSGSEAPQ